MIVSLVIKGTRIRKRLSSISVPIPVIAFPINVFFHLWNFSPPSSVMVATKKGDARYRRIISNILCINTKLMLHRFQIIKREQR